MRAVERNFRVPIPSHINLDFSAIPARRVCPFDCAAGVHLHPGHVHVHVELHVADIDELTVVIAKFDHNIVVAFTHAAGAAEEIYSQVVDSLGEEWRAGDLCWSYFLPRAFSAVENRDPGDG